MGHASGDGAASDHPDMSWLAGSRPQGASQSPQPHLEDSTTYYPLWPAETDREALAALYNATDGENWEYSVNWLSDAPLGQWFSVITNDDGRVTGLELWDNDLSGEIPAELGSLSNQIALNLYDNELSGCVPSSLEDQLTPDGLGDLPFC